MKFWFDNFLIKKLGYAMTNAELVTEMARRFSIPKIIVGPNIFPDRGGIFGDHIDEIARQCPNKRAFIVTDDYCVRFAKKIVRCFENRYDFNFMIFDKILPECPTDNVMECAKEMIEFEPDVIFALGGGSALDGAKLSWAMYERQDIKNLFEEFDVFTRLELRNKAFLIAVPTTSGTGSETTMTGLFTVEMEDGKHMKVPISNYELQPDYALLDPEFTYGLPPNLTAGTGLDALAHAIFGIVGPAHNEFATAMGLRAIKMIFEYLPRAYKDGNDREARLKMLEAATMAGICFDRGGSTGVNHAMGHQFGAMFGVHHGISVAILITYGLMFYFPFNDKYLEICDVLKIPDHESNRKRLLDLIDKINLLLEEIDVPTNLKGLGISKEDFDNNLDQLAENSLNDPTSFTAPLPMEKGMYKDLFRKAFEGKIEEIHSLYEEYLNE
ncbi:MAG: iron-containing alcohol dehydrogenase [Candidatus Lokiarchaeota archaeon]|nr:iron-containing alcohol dehydrogenase [Candidatus Lokiarchaeota archaeon]